RWAETLSEELLPEDLRAVEFLFELLLIVASPIKRGTRVQATEVGMTSDMVPMSVSDEHGCQWRQSWCKGMQGLVCTFGEIGSRTRVNADQLTPVLRDDEVVLREFEAGQRINASGNALRYAPRRERMTVGFVLRKRRCQCDRVIEIGIATAPQVILGSSCIAISER